MPRLSRQRGFARLRSPHTDLPSDQSIDNPAYRARRALNRRPPPGSAAAGRAVTRAITPVRTAAQGGASRSCGGITTLLTEVTRVGRSGRWTSSAKAGEHPAGTPPAVPDRRLSPGTTPPTPPGSFANSCGTVRRSRARVPRRRKEPGLDDQRAADARSNGLRMRDVTLAESHERGRDEGSADETEDDQGDGLHVAARRVAHVLGW